MQIRPLLAGHWHRRDSRELAPFSPQPLAGGWLMYDLHAFMSTFSSDYSNM